MTGDNLFSKLEILIPITDKTKIQGQEIESEESKARRAKKSQAFTVDLLADFITNYEKCIKGDRTAEAKYYCDENNYDYKKAVKAYIEDIEYEKSQK